MDYAVKLENATVRYNLAQENIDNIKEYIIKFVTRKLMFQEFFPVKDINLEIKPGESWGFVGHNGAGKSTLLKLISQIIEPHEGTVKVNGTISPMIELSAGMDSDMTARENIYLNGAFLGYSEELIDKEFDNIVDFAEIRDFLDVPLKNFSSGMAARLGFSIATIVKPDILIVDEVLSVGDAAFQEKSMARMKELISGGTTLLFVSHSSEIVKSICQKAVWLDHGTMVMSGDSEYVCSEYTKSLGI